MTATAKLAVTALPLIAAESTFSGVQSSQLGEMLVGVAALLIIGKLVWEGIDRVRGGSTQKREVTLSEQFSTREQCAERHEAICAELEKIDRERRTSVANLHEKIDHLSERLDSRIDAIPARTIALLAETKQLHRG